MTEEELFTDDEKELLSMLSESARLRVGVLLLQQKDILSRLEEEVKKTQVKG